MGSQRKQSMFANMSGYVGDYCAFHVDDGLEGRWVYSWRATMSKFHPKAARAKPRAGSAFGLPNSPPAGRLLPRCRDSRHGRNQLHHLRSFALPFYPTCLDFRSCHVLCWLSSHAFRRPKHAHTQSFVPASVLDPTTWSAASALQVAEDFLDRLNSTTN